MALAGELRVQAVPDSFRQIDYFIQGIGNRLRLSDDSLQETDSAVKAVVEVILQHAYPPGSTDDLLIRIETDDDDDDVIAITFVHRELAAVIPIPANGPIELHIVDATMSVLRRRIERDDNFSPLSTTEQKLDAIQTISEVMTTNIHLEDLLRLIVDKLVESIDSERGTLYLVDDEHGEIYSKILLEDADILSEIRIKIGEGIAGYVAATGEVVNIINAYDDPRFDRTFDINTGFRTVSMITAPMINPRKKVIGVVQLINKKNGIFTRRDERMLITMASQATISIENARLYAEEIEQRLVAHELSTARAIQRSFLPTDIPQSPGWELAAFWEPAHNVSGDFYIIQPLADNSAALLIADVCGKGIPAALFMAFSVTVLRFAMSFGFSPVELLKRANQTILMYNQLAEMFASVFVSYVDFNTGKMRMASGGHNPPLLYRAATQQIELLKIKGILVGLLEEVSFDEATVQLEPGDVLVMYTDGITEAMTLEDEEFGMERLESVIYAYAAESASELGQHILREVAAFSGNRGAFDDETMVIIKRSVS
jgi:sigma-B regulation protein RsbU (phosphoserine phosphatase)